jgi:hypothetical protein
MTRPLIKPFLCCGTVFQAASVVSEFAAMLSVFVALSGFKSWRQVYELCEACLA